MLPTVHYLQAYDGAVIISSLHGTYVCNDLLQATVGYHCLCPCGACSFVTVHSSCKVFFYTFCTARCTLVQGSLAVTCLYTCMQCWCIVIT